MTTPTQKLYAACLAFERATGREIPLDDIVLERDVGYGIHWRLRVLDQAIRISDSTVYDILEARAWRAVRAFGDHAEWSETIESDDGDYPTDPERVCCVALNLDGGYRRYPDLPTALLAVAAWVEKEKV